MNQTTIVALIGALGVIVGAILSFLASAFASKQKIRELEIANHQKLEESYRANIGNHIDTLYIPLNISLTKLANHYDKFGSSSRQILNSIEDKPDNVEQEKAEQERTEVKAQIIKCRTEFRQACLEYVKQISSLFDQGKDVYLTEEIAEQLRKFNNSLKDMIENQAVEEPGWGLEQATSIFPMWGGGREYKEYWSMPRLPHVVLRYTLPGITTDTPSPYASVGSRPYISDSTETSYTAVAATSDWLEDNIQELKSLIREITLGMITIPTEPISNKPSPVPVSNRNSSWIRPSKNRP